MAKAKEVTTRTAAPVARGGKDVANREQLDALMEATAGQGMEGATRDDIATPFLRILQDLSPQCKKLKPEYIPGAKPGMIFNTITKELYDKIRVVPCAYERTYLEWVPRGEKNGGLVAKYDMVQGAAKLATTTRDEGKQVLPNGNELADTRAYYVLLLKDDAPPEGCIIAMSATQIKISKAWFLQIEYSKQPTPEYRKGLPSFAWWYELGTKEDGNDKGSWYSWTIGPRERVLEYDIAARAKEFHRVVGLGQAKADFSQAAGDGAGAPKGRTLNEDGTPADLDNEIDA